jgi:uncharacterized membrane protein YbaN (DUF454 family)
MILVPLRIAGGFFLVALGIAGLVLPIMPGLIFLIPGLALLSRHFHWAHRMHTRLTEARQYCCQKARDAVARARAGASSPELAEEQGAITS